MSRSSLFGLAFFGVFLFLLYQMLRLLAPFGSALLLAAIIALALYPLYSRLVTRLKGRQALSALVMTFIVIVLVIGPTITLFGVLTSQAVAVYQGVSESILSGKLSGVWTDAIDRFTRLVAKYPILSTINIKEFILKSLGEVSTGLASEVGTLLKNTVILTIDLVVMLIALFFFFHNGETYYRTFIDMLPFSSDHKKAIARKVHDTFIAVVNGVFLIALLQGVMTGIGFALFGVPYSVFWGVLAAGLALLPIGGAALVWVPGAVYLYLKGSTLSAVFLAIWGVILVSLPDNFLKPLIIGRRANISSFFLFISILGGVDVYGVFGILLGPLVVTMLMAFVQIYREEYADDN
jgi:predicted PurR-regulated permease PerM